MAERDRQLGEGGGEVHHHEGVLLGGLVRLLLVHRQRLVVAARLAEVGLQRVEQVLVDVRHVHQHGLAGLRVAATELLVQGQRDDAFQLRGEADALDVDRHALGVAHPDQGRGQGAEQRHGARHEDVVAALVAAVRVGLDLADQDLADHVRIAPGERVEGSGLLVAGRYEEVERQHVVLAAVHAGQGEHVGIQAVVRLAVDEDEARAPGQGVGAQADERLGLARARGARHGHMLAAILVADPQLLAGLVVAADVEMAAAAI